MAPVLQTWHRIRVGAGGGDAGGKWSAWKLVLARERVPSLGLVLTLSAHILPGSPETLPATRTWQLPALPLPCFPGFALSWPTHRAPVSQLKSGATAATGGAGYRVGRASPPR